MKAIPVGLTGEARTIVTNKNTASAAGSGLLEVFATPMMISLIEEAAFKSVSPYLDEGESTVGTHLDVSHDAATPVGMEVCAKTTLTQVQGRKLTFNVAAYDETGLIGKGIHERFVVQREKFVAKTYRKLEMQPKES